MKVLFISGSLRKDSYNTRLLQAFEAALPEGVQSDWGSLEHPLYNEDLEKTDFPASVTALKEQIAAADSLIIATPEYNRGVPGVLKNTLDWVSRPYGNNSLTGKPVLIVSASPGSLGGALAHHQLIQSLVHMGAIVQPGIEFMVGQIGEKFDHSGALTDTTTQQHIAERLRAFLAT